MPKQKRVWRFRKVPRHVAVAAAGAYVIEYLAASTPENRAKIIAKAQEVAHEDEGWPNGLTIEERLHVVSIHIVHDSSESQELSHELQGA